MLHFILLLATQRLHTPIITPSLDKVENVLASQPSVFKTKQIRPVGSKKRPWSKSKIKEIVIRLTEPLNSFVFVLYLAGGLYLRSFVSVSRLDDGMSCFFFFFFYYVLRCSRVSPIDFYGTSSTAEEGMLTQVVLHKYQIINIKLPFRSSSFHFFHFL